MKTVAIFLGALLVLAGGFFIIKNLTKETRGKVVGEVIEVSFEQAAFDGPVLLSVRDSNEKEWVIAVPSMGLPLCPAKENIGDVWNVAVGDRVSVFGEVAEDGYIIPCENEAHYLEITGYMKDAAYGFEFQYKKSPQGYITIEDTESTHESFSTGIVLFDATEYEEFISADDVREGPPAMHVRVYGNEKNLDASTWVEEYEAESNSNLVLGDKESALVGGVDGVFYKTDGLYPTDVYVVTTQDHVYVLMGSYHSQESAMYNDFKDLVSSFTLI